jgi:hypothetical protein
LSAGADSNLSDLNEKRPFPKSAVSLQPEEKVFPQIAQIRKWGTLADHLGRLNGRAVLDVGVCRARTEGVLLLYLFRSVRICGIPFSYVPRMLKNWKKGFSELHY